MSAYSHRRRIAIAVVLTGSLVGLASPARLPADVATIHGDCPLKLDWDRAPVAQAGLSIIQ